jgi:hypothetical protein
LKNVLWKFWSHVSVAISCAATGAGIGGITAWFMTFRIDRPYQMAIEEAGLFLGAAMGLIFGCIAYYAIFRSEIDFSNFAKIVALTAVVSAATAAGMHLLTDTGGWIALPIGVIVFFAACIRVRSTAARIR